MAVRDQRHSQRAHTPAGPAGAGQPLAADERPDRAKQGKRQWALIIVASGFVAQLDRINWVYLL